MQALDVVVVTAVRLRGKERIFSVWWKERSEWVSAISGEHFVLPFVLFRLVVRVKREMRIVYLYMFERKGGKKLRSLLLVFNKFRLESGASCTHAHTQRKTHENGGLGGKRSRKGSILILFPFSLVVCFSITVTSGLDVELDDFDFTLAAAASLL